MDFLISAIETTNNAMEDPNVGVNIDKIVVVVKAYFGSGEGKWT